MKKLSLLLMIGFALSLSCAKAQTYTMTGTYSPDTVTNTATKACSLKVSNPYRQVTIGAFITKISGTVAGTVTLQGSLDGVNFFTVDSSAIQTDGNINSPATYTATNVASQLKVWILNYTPYLWYKLSYTGSGTMSAKFNGYLLPRKQD